MPFPPSGSIYLIGGLQIDNSYLHTLSFDNLADQLTYFQDPARVIYTDNDYTYVRKDQSIKVKYSYEDLWDVNYVLYENESGKWIFSFVTDKLYINDNMTEILIETDVMQTFAFDYSIDYCLVEREHQDRWSGTASPILNYVDEGLAYGDEYIKQFEKRYRDGSDQNIAWFLVVSTAELESIPVLPPAVVQGTPSPLFYYLLPMDRRDSAGSLYDFNDGAGNQIMNAQDFTNYIGDTPGIVSISYIPYLPFIVNVVESGIDITITVSGNEWIPQQATTVAPIFFILRLNTDQIDAFDSFIIGAFQKYEGLPLPGGFNINQPRDHNKESKFLTFPYMYNLLTDGQATPLMIKNEYVETGIEFVRCSQSMNLNPKTKYFIEDYRGESNGKTYNITNTGVNDLPLATDAYQNYITQNKAQATAGIGLSLVAGVTSLGLGIASGGVALPLLAGTALTSISSIGSELAKRKDLQTTPDSLRNSGNNIAFSFVDDAIDLFHMRYEISHQWKHILGDFWAMYGYKCNELKIPDIKSRYYYNYIKCHQANIVGSIDMDDLRKIKSVFENGVTFWHKRVGDNLNPLNDYKWDNVEMRFI